MVGLQIRYYKKCEKIFVRIMFVSRLMRRKVHLVEIQEGYVCTLEVIASTYAYKSCEMYIPLYKIVVRAMS